MGRPKKIKPFDNYGDLMTMQDWIECVVSGGFIDYDGYGRYATKDGIRDSKKLYDVKPSDLEKGKVDKSWTHVVWYNR